MLSRRIEIGIGLAAAVLALLMLFVAIPLGIVTPQNVRSIFLSPIFWPTVLAICLLLVAIAVACRAYFGLGGAGEPEEMETFDRQAILRLSGFLVLIAVYYFLIPLIGMVWSSSLAFAAMLLLTNASTKAIGLLCAIVLPILLYAFFYHVAAVPIPQSDFLRLP